MLENAGARYYDGTQPGDAIDILSNNGVNYFRVRIFVAPNSASDPFVVQNVPYAVALAQRIKAAGGKVLLDFHYSDSWADPGQQTKPVAWTSLTGAALQQQVFNYTRQTMESFAAAGVSPEMVQIGNEISNGMLWNEGYPWSGGSHNAGFDRLAGLLNAGINGAKAGAPVGQEPLIMIHHDKGADWSTTSYYFNKLVARNVDFDLIGYSYYPKFHYNPTTGAGGINDVIQNLNNTASTFGKPVVLAEVGFPSRGASFEPDYEFDVSPIGQQQYLQAIVNALQNVPNGLGWGAFWWYAEARPAGVLPVWEGGRYGLFDQAGRLLPAAQVFASLPPQPVDGDFNADGQVNSADYTLWRDSLGQTVSPGTGGDADLDGAIDSGDYQLWVRNYGNSASGASVVTSVPEPEAVMISLGLAMLLGCRARVRRSSCTGTPTCSLINCCNCWAICKVGR